MKFSNKFSQSVFSLLFLCLSLFFFSQDKPYWQDIKDFKTKDQQNGIPKRAILFIGSSSSQNGRMLTIISLEKLLLTAVLADLGL